MPFPYERYARLTQPLKTYYPTGEDVFARWVVQTIAQAGPRLAQLLGQPMPAVEVLIVTPQDWDSAPHDEPEELDNPHPYWTDVTSPPTVVIPLAIDVIFGEPTQAKLAFMLYHELALTFLEADPRPYPADYPLWADEWQLKFAALWLAQQLNSQQGIVNVDLHTRYAEIFETEEDGKTPITIRGFDWYEDTTAADYLCYELLLEQLAADLLAHAGPQVLPRFLALYRRDAAVLLSDEVSEMLGTAVGVDGVQWLEAREYF
jgi:hypothetical protein